MESDREYEGLSFFVLATAIWFMTILCAGLFSAM